MSKNLLLADLHLHTLPSWRYEWCKKFVDDLLKSKEYEHLYILGDAIEIRDKVDSRTLNLLIKLLTQWKCGDVVWLSGQHDSFIPGYATLHEMDGIGIKKGNIYVVDNEVFEHDDNYFIPYQRQDENYLELLKQIPSDKIVFTHLPVKEMIELFGATNVKAISLKKFKRFKMVISGDIHKFHDFENFHYVGAPSQRDWRDRGVEGQIGVLDGDKFYRVPTEHPKHIEVTKASDIPEKGEYIIKTPRGQNITASNVIQAMEKSDIDVESIELTTSYNVEEQINSYIKENKPPVKAEEAFNAAMRLLPTQ